MSTLDARLDDLREALVRHSDQDHADFMALRKWVGKVDKRTAWLLGIVIGVNGLPIWIVAVLQILKALNP